MSGSNAASAGQSCRHSALTSCLSAYAQSAEHRSYSDLQILNAMTGRRKHTFNVASGLQLGAFPAPLVLPGDAIDLDPKYPPQSFRSWLNEGVRNHITGRRNVLYVAAPPKIDRSVGFMGAWSKPNIRSSTDQQATFPIETDVQGVIAYLQAFYHGLKVELLPTPLTFTSWDDPPEPKQKSKARARARTERDVQAVALSTDTEAVRIQVRSSLPLSSESSEHCYPYSHQLSLNDMTDVALSVLPSDAYALVVLTEHDMYESADDEFCCGRAWGASRVAIVSGARYQPCLDSVHGVDRDHLWPASHCSEFVERMSLAGQSDELLERGQGAKRRKTGNAVQARSLVGSSPLERSFEAHKLSIPNGQLTATDLDIVFLFRLSRTVSHELGHCFGLDHCMYKACVMQGTASVAEDMRQPPYLCPVCEAKVAWAIVGGHAAESDAAAEDEVGKAKRKRPQHHETQSDGEKLDHQLAKWKSERHAAMQRFCEQYNGAFAPLLAWSKTFLEAA